MFKNTRTPIACAVLHALITPALAASPTDSDTGSEPNATLPNVVIRAQTYPITGTTQPDAAAAKERQQNIPGGGGVVERSQFDAGRVSTFSDSLGYATGVFIQPRFGSEESRLSIRGSGVQRTFHGRGIRLMQDGIPVNLADGSFDFQAIEPLATQYVEVLRGANAFGLGAATLGGAVNYVSQTGLTSPGGQTRLELGSYGYRRMHVQTGFANEKVDAFASISEFRQNGYRDHAHQQSTKAIANVGFRPNGDIETRIFISSTRSDSELPGNLTPDQVQQNPRQAAAANLLLNQKRDIDLDRIAHRTVLKLPANAVLDVSWYAAFKDLYHPIFQVIDQYNKDWGASFKLEIPHTVWALPATSTFGWNPSKGITLNRNIANAGGAPTGPDLDRSRQTAQNQEFFYELNTRIRTDWALITGLNHQRSQRRYQGFNTTAIPNQFSFDNAYNRTSPRVGVIHDLSPTTQVYANFSGSFEPPSFGELGVGGASAAITSNNAAQSAKTLEMGTRGTWEGVLHRTQWDVAVYRAQVDNKLIAYNVPLAGGFANVTSNVPKTIHQGVELGAFTQMGAWNLRTSTLINDLRFKGSADFGDNRIAGVPLASSRIAVERALTDTLRASVAVEGATATYIDHLNTSKASGYGILNARLNGKWGKHMDWFVEARNLADRTYIATPNVVRLASLPNANLLPGDGRGFYTGVTLRW